MSNASRLNASRLFLCSFSTPSHPARGGFFVNKRETIVMDAELGLDEENYQEFSYTDVQSEVLESVLKTIPETLTVESKVFLKAILELERQEEIKAFRMLAMIEQMEARLSTLKALFFAKNPLCAKSRLYHLFLSSEAWGALFTEDFIQHWQAEAESGL